MKILRLSDILRKQYGKKVYKLSLSSGCSCPNRDGSIMYGGCTFCSEGGSGEFASDFKSIPEQIKEAKELIASKTEAELFIAYFQSFSNTYGDVERLKSLFTEAISRDDIAALSIGTRPDCLGKDVMALLKELNQIKPVWVELGLQTIHEKTAERIHRGYNLKVFEDAYRRLKESGLEIIVHVIFNLPGETREDMLDTIRYLAKLQPQLDGIKLHMLQILKGTQLAREYEEAPFPVFSLEEYGEILIEALKILPEETVIHRFTGDGPKGLLIAPEWSADKKHVLNTLNKMIAEVKR